jgi:glutamate racemase
MRNEAQSRRGRVLLGPTVPFADGLSPGLGCRIPHFRFPNTRRIPSSVANDRCLRFRLRRTDRARSPAQAAAAVRLPILADQRPRPYGARSFGRHPRVHPRSRRVALQRGLHPRCLAANTASARALRTIQQRHLPNRRPDRRVSASSVPPSRPWPAAAGRDPGCHAALARRGHRRRARHQGHHRLRLLRNRAAQTRAESGVDPAGLSAVGTTRRAGETEGPAPTGSCIAISTRPRRTPAAQRILLGCTHNPILLPVSAGSCLPPSRCSPRRYRRSRLADWLTRHTRPGKPPCARRRSTCRHDRRSRLVRRHQRRLLGTRLTAERARLRPLA